MKKSINILLIFMITFFTLPIGGITAFADEKTDEKTYDNIADGDYDITAKAMHETKDESSGAAGFINEEAKLFVKDGEIQLAITVPHNDMAQIAGMQVEGNEGTTEESDNLTYRTYKLDTLKRELMSQVQYAVPSLGMEHDVPFRFILEGLDDLPEQPDEEKAPEEREVGKLLTEDEADAVYQLDYETDSQATAGQLENPVKLLEKGNKEYIQIPISESGAQFFRSLKFNEKEVTWNSITEGPYNIQFELPNGIGEKLDVSMVIQAGPNVMPHDDIKLWFDEDSLETIKEPEAEPEKNEIEQGAKTSVKANDIIIVKDSQSTQLTMPDALPSDAKITINSAKDNVENEGDLKVAGNVLEFDFEGIEDFEGTFELVMGYDQEKYNDDDYDLDIYYFDGNEWIAQEGEVKDGKIAVNVDHFSTYGVFAQKSEEPEEPKEDPEKPSDPLEVPEDAEEVDYTIMHENGEKESTANSFFEKPGLLFEKDGKQYVQVTVTNSDMVKELSSKHGDAVIVNENDDGSMDVQFRVNDDLSDTLLKMRIVVPGMYDTEHDALFSFGEEKPEEPEEPKEDPEESKEDPEKKPDKPVKSELEPDEAFEIDYVIKHEDGIQDSVSNNFFTGEAILLEKDGKTYVQLTITNGDMIKKLKNKYGEALLIEENKDGSIVVQLRVSNDLSDLTLDMHIVVPDGAIPGFPGYDEDHKAILVFDKDSKKEIDVGNHMLAGTDDATIDEDKDENGVEKPEFGDGNGDDNDNKDGDTVTPEKTDNPQTGDTTNIIPYLLLLIGSLTPLVIKLKRRFVS